jgi:hypothetical protein
MLVAMLLTLRCGLEHSPLALRVCAHRDGKFPWCEACAYADTGLHRSETRADLI